MRNTNWVINYREYDSLEELDPKDRPDRGGHRGTENLVCSLFSL